MKNSDKEYLKKLADKIFHIPAMYGVDQGDYDTLLQIVASEEPKEQVVYHVYAHGDPSVGLNGFSLTGTIDNFDMKRDVEDCSVEGRKEFRKSLTEFFTTWLDHGAVDVWFDDECPDCFKVGCKGECCREEPS